VDEIAVPPRDVAEFEKVCRSQGLAVTIQRRAVFEELAVRRDHPTADKVYEVLRERLPGISRTTVYRVLDDMVGAGLARRVDHPGAVARFDPVTSRHHHLVCQRCGTLVDIEDDLVPELPLPRIAGKRPFRITGYSVNFTGLCAECQ
jgi:Fur family peroxide stress response transcriptional regulator